MTADGLVGGSVEAEARRRAFGEDSPAPSTSDLDEPELDAAIAWEYEPGATLDDVAADFEKPAIWVAAAVQRRRSS